MAAGLRVWTQSGLSKESASSRAYSKASNRKKATEVFMRFVVYFGHRTESESN
jgi:hypothetical protein